MIESFAHLAALSREWGINEEDILFIALNHCGLDSTLDRSRMRFRLRLDPMPDEEFFFILSLGRSSSPFVLADHEIRFRGKRIAQVTGLEDDDAVLGYFRNGCHVLTLNSNARSQCVGCVFCPNTLEAASDPRLVALSDLSAYSAVVNDFRLGGHVWRCIRVTVCTGCSTMNTSPCSISVRSGRAATWRRTAARMHSFLCLVSYAPRRAWITQPRSGHVISRSQQNALSTAPCPPQGIQGKPDATGHGTNTAGAQAAWPDGDSHAHSRA